MIIKINKTSYYKLRHKQKLGFLIKNIEKNSFEPKKTGILIVNLGTPKTTDYKDIRKYLKEFLSDRRVIELHPVIWQIILNLFVLTFRPLKTAKLYKKTLLKDSNELPLRHYTKKQSEKLQLILKKKYKNKVTAEWAMCYGSPSIINGIESLKNEDCDNIIIFPLYPQYSATTTASVCDCVFKNLMKMRVQPSVQICQPYGSSEIYIETLSKSIEEHLLSLKWKPEKILVSFHGLPQKYCDKGDPYRNHCKITYELIKNKLETKGYDFILTFQSRFGYNHWIKPYTNETIKNLALSGIKNIALICPGFPSDCLETLLEINIEAREVFMSHGGENFTYIPCLNDSEPHIKMLTALIERNLSDLVKKNT